ncbi:MAG: M1 family metallopeptidase [Polyangiaceae bacterium]|nr:M1 family metallopeptidase [Polyangiaceae bacterium]
MSLDLELDFERRVLRGTAALDLSVKEGVEEVVLDTRGLELRSVSDGAGGELEATLAEEDALLGSALTVRLRGGSRRVVIEYVTSPDAPALQWLDPAQTAGKRHPFVFTQGHAIQTRSWIPLQDSPAIRVTYDARISVPAPLAVVMSAERALGTPPSSGTGRVFAFRMNEAIPPYLIALAAGDIASRDVGPRTAVFAEPALLERAAHELAELEVILDAAEAVCGPYRWGRFDVLVMPPSFPYGGMENPRMTFLSPSILAGDRSLVTVVAHELAHAWAGNLVTNATWNDFWLNEGTTVYVELRLNEALWGLERAELLRSWGHRELAAEVGRMGESAPDTRLRYDMTGRDPAEGVTVIPYLKGAAFFWALEDLVGRERLDRWLRGWFERHAFESVTTDELVFELEGELLGKEEATGLGLSRWLDAPGPPPSGPPPSSALLERLDAAASAILAGADPAELDAAGWSPQATRHFLGSLLSKPPGLEGLSRLDEVLALSLSQNAEVLAPWLRLQARAHNDAACSRIEAFLLEHGRSKYLRPLYQELLASEWGAPLAHRAYSAARPTYHPLVRASLDRLMGRVPG